VRGLGTAVNVATVLAGTGVGVAVGHRLAERVRTTLLTGLGLVTAVLGLRDAGATHDLVFPLAAIVIGGVVGELLRVEDGLEGLAGWVRRRLGVAEGEAGRFVEGFLSATLLFCVGPLTILGSISDGLGHGSQDLIVKAALDGSAALALASTLGVGVGLSAVAVLVVQGGLTLAAGAVAEVLTDRMVDELTATGGVVILGIALRLLDLKDVRIGSFLPALVLAPVVVALFAR
jgi:uncharacterized membrane protein YqgA involved in biofilm formation